MNELNKVRASDLSMNSDFFRQDSDSIGHCDDQLSEIEERFNNKIAHGMKKAVHMIVSKLDLLIQSKIKLIVKEEIETKICELRNLSDPKAVQI